MKKIKFLIQKEFLQIFRNKSMLPIIFVMPVVQLIILAHAATFEIRQIPVYFVDHDRSTASQYVLASFAASENFQKVGYSHHTPDAVLALTTNEAKLAVVIPAGFERQLMLGYSARVQLLLDAVDGFSAGIASQYAQSILSKASATMVHDGRTTRLPVPATVEATPSSTDNLPVTYTGEIAVAASVTHQRIHIEWSHWYNPELNYHFYMVPGILVVLVTMIGGFLSGMNIVREREMGTMEQLNVTPITKYEFIAGKLLPFWLLSMAELAFGLLIAWAIFGLVSQGSLFLVFGAAAAYLLVVLGIGLLVSTISDSQQQAMFITWFIMVLFILMSGLFTPVASMPEWAQVITWFNPVAWFIDIMRRVMLTGATLSEIWFSVTILILFGIFVITIAVFRYRKTSR